MYGYIIVNKPELKIKDYDYYLGHYCGLCHSLKQQYGNIPRLTLSYDLTFLTILLTSLYEDVEVKKDHKTCLKHIGQKRLTYQSEITEYVADMSILLSYLKCQDDIQDESSLKARIMKLFLSSDFKKVQNHYPQKVQKITQLLIELTQQEKQDNRSIEEMSSYFGKVFGEIFTYKEDEWHDYLYNVGYYLGEYVYLLDAYDDLQKDIEEKQYNPFIGKENVNEYAKEVLTILISECCDYFERLPIIEHIDLLRNILYSGVWTKYNDKLKKEEENNGSL